MINNVITTFVMTYRLSLFLFDNRRLQSRYNGSLNSLATSVNSVYNINDLQNECVALQKNPPELKTTPCGSIGTASEPDTRYGGICEINTCRTTSSKKCQFPFRYVHGIVKMITIKMITKK